MCRIRSFCSHDSLQKEKSEVFCVCQRPRMRVSDDNVHSGRRGCIELRQELGAPSASPAAQTEALQPTSPERRPPTAAHSSAPSPAHLIYCFCCVDQASLHFSLSVLSQPSLTKKFRHPLSSSPQQHTSPTVALPVPPPTACDLSPTYVPVALPCSRFLPSPLLSLNIARPWCCCRSNPTSPLLRACIPCWPSLHPFPALINRPYSALRSLADQHAPTFNI
ncbi:hypothetical protein HDK77DRAFT_103053 [Phyllosticta capitalensis]|uniref:Uncharacterized protein n=1 Tax=Phyllosticta capitalensis TaxID=121624 RepID=A0ABR1YCJ1_9PEZI